MRREEKPPPSKPVEVPKATPIKPDAGQVLRDAETTIAGRDTEKVFVMERDGNVLLEKVGDKSSVSFTTAELKIMKNQLLTHNHPSGTSFSPQDIELAATYNLAEMRAVGQTYRYSIKRPSIGWDKAWHDNVLKPVYQQHNSQTYNEFYDKIRQRAITTEWASLNHFHYVWSKVAKELALDYVRMEW